MERRGLREGSKEQIYHASIYVHSAASQEIVEEWVEFARTLKPWAKGLSKKDLRDHAEELLSAIVSDMKLSQSRHQQSEKSKGREAG